MHLFAKMKVPCIRRLTFFLLYELQVEGESGDVRGARGRG